MNNCNVNISISNKTQHHNITGLIAIYENVASTKRSYNQIQQSKTIKQ